MVLANVTNSANSTRTDTDIDEYRRTGLSGVERAAVFLLSIGQDRAAVIMQKLSDREVERVSRAMSNLGRVEATTVESVLSEFVSKIGGISSSYGGLDVVHQILSSSLPADRVDELMRKLRSSRQSSTWEQLSQVREETIASFLRYEHPQTSALILSHMNPMHSALVLSHLPDSVAIDIVIRMLRIENVQRDVLEEVERNVRNELIGDITLGNQGDNFAMVANMFNSFDSSTETRLMDLLETFDYEAAERVKALRFTFEDLLRLDDLAVQQVIRMVDRDILSLALKNASPAIMNLFLRNMSERASRVLREDIASSGPMRLSRIEDAQSRVLKTTKELIDSGEFELTPRTA